MAQDGRILLHLAISEGHAEVVSALLTAGVDKEAKDEVNGVGWGVLKIARILLVPEGRLFWS